MAAEQLRRALLKEIGITSWFPRIPLVGAARSHEQCLQDFLAEPQVAPGAASVEPLMRVTAADAAVTAVSPVVNPPVQAAAGASSPGSSTAALARLLADKPADQGSGNHGSALRQEVSLASENSLSSVDQKNDSGIEQAVDGSHDEVEAFGFSWFNIDKRLAVLTMLPPDSSRVSASCKSMLMRMLAALHTPWQALEISEQSFHWPFADDLGLKADNKAAQQAVDGFIARRMREQSSAMLLVLADEVPWFLTQSTPGSKAATGQLLIHRQFGFSMLSTYSLHAMERDAGLKRDAWQAMQVLRERLNR